MSDLCSLSTCPTAASIPQAPQLEPSECWHLCSLLISAWGESNVMSEPDRHFHIKPIGTCSIESASHRSPAPIAIPRFLCPPFTIIKTAFAAQYLSMSTPKLSFDWPNQKTECCSLGPCRRTACVSGRLPQLGLDSRLSPVQANTRTFCRLPNKEKLLPCMSLWQAATTRESCKTYSSSC